MIGKIFSVRSLLKISPYLICILFFIAYAVLSIVRHDNYQSFGYDLGINDQVVWRYAHFQPPLNTIHAFPDKTKLYTHVELVYALISPFYWIWETRKMLLLVETAAVCLSGIAVYLLARKKRLKVFVSLSLVVSYLGFFGVQGAMWFDTHSSTYAAAFLMWFIYFLETKKKISSIIFFFLAITAKENIGVLTFLVAFVYFWKQRSKLPLFFMGMSVAYVAFIFFVFFPHIMHTEYLYKNSGGLLSNFNPLSLVDTEEKRSVIFYSFLSYGFLPLLSPLYLLPVVGDLATYFVIANELSASHGFFGHYRITLTPLLIWATIVTIQRYKRLNMWYIGVYLIVCIMISQYMLHLPLSYLTKSWFWTQPASVKTINEMRRLHLPKNASVVAQNNIVPHISQRDKIYSLYPEKQKFDSTSPCGESTCNWFRWYGSPEFLFIDTANDWDSRHLLVDRVDFVDGLSNLEKAGVVEKYKQMGSTILYKIKRNPEK